MDAGFTEDEAFDLIELVIGDHNATSLAGGTMCSAREEESIRTEQPEYLRPAQKNLRRNDQQN